MSLILVRDSLKINYWLSWVDHLKKDNIIPTENIPRFTNIDLL